MTSLGRAAVAFAALLVVLVITSCGPSEANGSVVEVGARSAVTLIVEREHVVLDLRSPEAFAAGRVRGAVNLDARAGDFEDRVEALDEETTYLVYAQTAERSAMLADAMVSLGIDRVLDAGAFGMLAIAGAPVEADD